MELTVSSEAHHSPALARFLTSLGLLLSRSHEQSNLVDAQSLGIFVNVTGIVVFFLIVIYHYIVTEPKSKKEETE